MRFRARWILPIDADPVAEGIVAIEDGRILKIGDGISVGKRDPDVEDLGNVAVLPGLINAHTHLEFSNLTHPVPPPQPFTKWIAGLVKHRQQRTTPTVNILRQGIQESLAAGVTTIGEIATEGWSGDAFSGTDSPRAVVFRELLGFTPDRIDSQMEVARQHIQLASAAGSLGYGLSPHAPYSVHPELFRQLIEMSAVSQTPVAMHLAETQAELELLARGTGPFVEMLQNFGVWQDNVLPTGSRPLNYLQGLARVDCGLIIHGNYLDDEEIAFLARHPQLTVVYCPRTHRYFGHPPHPWRKMLDSGVQVAVGTDGRGSNPDLNLLAELHYLRVLAPDLPARTLLRLGTLAGARALGMEAELGSLAAGKLADLIVVDLQQVNVDDPHEAVLDPHARIVRCMRDGRWIAAD